MTNSSGMNLDSFSWPAKRASIRDDTSNAGKVDPRFGNQRSKPGQKVQRLEDHMGGAVSIGRFQFVADPSIIQKRQAFFGYRGSGDIPAQPFQLVTLIRLRHYPGM